MTSNTKRLSELGSDQHSAAHSWLPLAMTDAALFHSILCGSALILGLSAGRRESVEQVKHMKEAVHLLSAKLQDPNSELSDSTIAAVAHLADFEASATFRIGLKSCLIIAEHVGKLCELGPSHGWAL